MPAGGPARGRPRLARLALAALLALTPLYAVAAADKATVLATAIAAQPVETAIAEYIRQTGVQVVFLSADAEGRRSHAVAAGTPGAAALTVLLQGTGLMVEVLNPREVRVYAPPGATHPPPPPSPRPLERAEPTESGSVAEVVVTSVSKIVPVERVPASLEVWTARALESSGVSSITDLAAHTPGAYLTLNTALGSDLLHHIVIRGVAPAGGGTPTTGVYIDDTPVQVPNELNSLLYMPMPVTFDLNRVEVLRGPQGTLAGNASEGGLVHFVMNQPSVTESDGFVRAGLAATEQGALSYDAGAAVGAPLINGVLGVRASVWSRAEGGFIDHVNPADGSLYEPNANSSRTHVARAALAWAPNADTSVTASFHYQSASLHDAPVFYTAMSNSDAGQFNNGKLLLQPAENTFYLSSVKAVVEFGALELSSVTSYFHRTGSITKDLSDTRCCQPGQTVAGFVSSPDDAVPEYLTLAQSGLTQEFKLSTTDDKQPLGWLLGMMATHSKQHELTFTPASPAALRSGSDGSIDDRDTETELDIFSNLDYRMTPRVRLSAGVRVGAASHAATRVYSGDIGAAVARSGETRASDSTVTPRFDIAFQADDDSLYYGGLATGHRVGGLNAAIPAPCDYAVPPAFRPETLWGAELGMKLHRAEGRVYFVASVFHEEWRSVQQFMRLPCGWTDIENAGAAASDGADLTLKVTPIEDLSASLALGYANARYLHDVTRVGNVIVVRGDSIGNPAVAPPPWSALTSLEWQSASFSFGRLTLRADDAFQSRNPGPFWTDHPTALTYNVAFKPNPSINLLGLRVGLRNPHAEVWLYLSNALNAHPLLSQLGSAGPPAAVAATTVRPRTLGITGTWRL